jgi:hypothetical protein
LQRVHSSFTGERKRYSCAHDGTFADLFNTSKEIKGSKKGGHFSPPFFIGKLLIIAKYSLSLNNLFFFRLIGKSLPKMKKRHFILAALFLLSCVITCHAQNYFVNTYGLDANPCYSIVCTDNCFFSVASNMAGLNGLLAIKTDPSGNILWSRQVSITNAPYVMLCDITQAADGGFLILAYTQIPGPVYSYQTVIKLDPSGNFLWTRSYSSISSNVANSIIKNNDNGFMFVGGGCNGDNYVFKCNPTGAIVWQKGFTLETGPATSIATHDYNHFVVSGYTGTDLVFFEIDVSGNLYWQSVISFPNQGIGTFSLKPTLDNGYIASGQVALVSSFVNHAFIVKINSSGQLSWLKVYTVSGSESEGRDLTENSDSSIVLVGFTSKVNIKGLMIKTDKNGTMMFAKGEINQQYYSDYTSVNRYSQGKILMTGKCQSGFQNTFIAVSDDSFSSFCNVADLPVTDSVPPAVCTFITNTPVNLSFQVDSLSVSVTPHALTKSVFCSSYIVPYVVTGSATSITQNSATLNGLVMPAGNTLTTFFEYGTTASYGSTVPALPGTVSGNNPTSVIIALTSLSPNTVYHYRCKATNGINTYYGNDSIFIIVCNPTVPVISGNDSLCPNSGYYTYQTQPGFLNYQWTISAGGTITGGQGTPAAQVTWQQSGHQWIRVTFTDSTVCSPVSPTEFPVYVTYLPGPAGPVTGSQLVCAGTEGVSYHTDPVPGAITYVWSLPPNALVTQGQWTNEILVTFTDSAQSGSVTVYGNNLCGNGPGSPGFPVTVNPLPPDPIIHQTENTLISNAPAGNQWLHDQQPIPGANETWYEPNANGDYSVMVTLNGCSSDTSNVISFILTGYEIAGGNQNISIFPNPSKGLFYLMGQDFPGSGATVYDLTGKIVYDEKIRMNLLDLRDLPPGLYILTIQTSKGSSHSKIQIKE